MKRAIALMLAVWLLTTCLAAQGDDLKLQGLLINQTQTTAGRVFFTEFSGIWAVVAPNASGDVVVHERPSLRNGSQVTVKYAGRVVFQGFIGVNPERVRQVAQEVARGLAGQVGYYQSDVMRAMQQLFPDPDMAPDELDM